MSFPLIIRDLSLSLLVISLSFAFESAASLASSAALWLSVSLMIFRRNLVFGLGLFVGGLRAVRLGRREERASAALVLQMLLVP